MLHIRGNFLENAFLRRRGMKGKYLLDGFTNLAGQLKRNSHALPHAMTFEFQPDFQEKPFLKDQPPMRRCPAFGKVGKNFARRWKMDFIESAAAIHQSQAAAERLGNAVRDVRA